MYGEENCARKACIKYYRYYLEEEKRKTILNLFIIEFVEMHISPRLAITTDGP